MPIKEFFQTIQWGATLQIAAIRIAIASIIWSVVLVIFGDTAATGLLTQILALLVFLTACVAIAIPAIGLARANVPWVGLAAIPAWLIVVADPIVKLLHAKRPDIVPVDVFKLINPPVLAVFDNGEENEAADDLEVNSKTDKSTNESPFDTNRASPDADTLFAKSKEIFETGNDPELGQSLLFQSVAADPHHIGANAFLAAVIYDTDAPNRQATAVNCMTNALLGVHENKLANVEFAYHHSFILGGTAAKDRDWQVATAAFLLAFALKPDDAGTQRFLFISAEGAGAEEMVKKYVQPMVLQDNENKDLHLLLGKLYVNIARDNENGLEDGTSHAELLRLGEASLTTVLQSDPENVEANYRLFFIHLMRDDPEKMQSVIDLLKRIAPEKVNEIAVLLSHEDAVES